MIRIGCKRAEGKCEMMIQVETRNSRSFGGKFAAEMCAVRFEVWAVRLAIWEGKLFNGNLKFELSIQLAYKVGPAQIGRRSAVTWQSFKLNWTWNLVTVDNWRCLIHLREYGIETHRMEIQKSTTTANYNL